MATAAAGVAGGVMLGRSGRRQDRKVLGIPVPDVNIDLGDMGKQIGGMGKQIGEAGRQLGKLASEVRAAREKAEKISRAIS